MRSGTTEGSKCARSGSTCGANRALVRVIPWGAIEPGGAPGYCSWDPGERAKVGATMTAFLLVAMTILAQTAPSDDVFEPLDAPVAAPVASAETSAVSAPEKAQAKFPVGTVVYVNATSLGLRDAPKRDALLIHYIPQQAKVTVIEPGEGPVADKIGDKPGAWIRVEHGGHKGYAFDAFLIAAPPALEENLDWICAPGKKVGPITAKTTYTELVAVFGAANIGDATIPLGEGKTEAGTVIFPKDPDKRLFVQWAIPKEKLHSVIVEGTRWKTGSGIGIGTPLSEVVKANGGPFSFAGFGWDYAGYVINWKGGLLEADHKLGEDISLFLAAQTPYLPADLAALQGDKEYSTELPQAAKVNLRVKAMTIQLRE